MTNFVVVYTGGGMPESEEEQAVVMGAWGTWYEGMGAAIVDGGNRFAVGDFYQLDCGFNPQKKFPCLAWEFR